MSDLSTIHTGEVREVAIQITRAGDGLSEALKAAPIALDHGEEVFYLLKGRVAKVGFTEVKPGSEDLVRVHTIVTQAITQVPSTLAEPILRDAAVALREKLDQLAGVTPLFKGDGGVVPFEALTDEQKGAYLAHGKGEHASGPVDGCPLCDSPVVRDPEDAQPAKARRARKGASDGE